MSRVQFKVDLFCIDFKQYINTSIETKQYYSKNVSLHNGTKNNN